jgi:hypothetical protein
VTRAFYPSPPLRQDCEEIFSPSTGAVSAGVIASAVAGLKPTCAVDVAGAGDGAGPAAAFTSRTDPLSAGLLGEPTSSAHAPTPAIRTAGTQTNPDRRYLAAGFSGRPEKLPPDGAGPANSMPYSPVSIVIIATGRPKRTYCLLQRTVKKPREHYTARLQTRLPIARFRRFLIN